METYYAQLKKPVLKYVKHFQNDFLVYDKSLLNRYKGKFVLGMRISGTNLFLFDNDYDDYSKEDFLNAKFWLIADNKRFFVGDNGTIKEISKEQVEFIIDEFIENQSIDIETKYGKEKIWPDDNRYKYWVV